MDWVQLISIGASALLGIGVIAAIIAKIVGKSERVLVILDEIIDVLRTATTALKDGVLSQDEIKAIIKEANEALTEIKKGLNS